MWQLPTPGCALRTLPPQDNTTRLQYYNHRPPRSPSGDALQHTNMDQAHRVAVGGPAAVVQSPRRRRPLAQTPTTASAERDERSGSSPLANSNLPGGVLSTPSGDQYDSGSSLLSDRFLRIER